MLRGAGSLAAGRKLRGFDRCEGGPARSGRIWQLTSRHSTLIHSARCALSFLVSYIHVHGRPPACAAGWLNRQRDDGGRSCTAIRNTGKRKVDSSPLCLVRRTSPTLESRDALFGNPICARICARDATGRVAMGERQRTRYECPSSVRRGQGGDQRQGETPETRVVWLITQRSRVQIPPPLPRPEALFRTGRGPLTRDL